MLKHQGDNGSKRSRWLWYYRINYLYHNNLLIILTKNKRDMDKYEQYASWLNEQERKRLKLFLPKNKRGLILYTIENNVDNLKKLIEEKQPELFGDIKKQSIPRHARFMDIKTFKELLPEIPAEDNEKKEVLKVLEDYDLDKEFLVFVMDKRIISKKLFCIYKFNKINPSHSPYP
ncbi:MAG TPA: hypothetical protein VJZ93_03750 [Candidatus Nanoarchaeia archaeon]|nr:hypothetical protein [Candidatus Nanoarchaeia archaeon]